MISYQHSMNQWDSNEKDLSEMIRKKEMEMKKKEMLLWRMKSPAIVVVHYNRPLYLEQALMALVSVWL